MPKKVLREMYGTITEGVAVSEPDVEGKYRYRVEAPATRSNPNSGAAVMYSNEKLAIGQNVKISLEVA